jgi:hypothetical protein
MSEFLDKLNQLEQQLKQEEAHGKGTDSAIVTNRGNSPRSSGDDSVCKATSVGSGNVGPRSSSVLRGKVPQETLSNDIGKEKKIMITAEAAASDLKAIEESGVTDGVKVVRAIAVLVKFLSTMRSNQLLTDNDKLSIQKAKVNRKPEVKPVA